MDSLHIKLMGDSSLYKKSLNVKDYNSDMMELINNLKYTMKKHKGVGIAAPQIGINLRIICYGFQKNIRYPDESPIEDTILINPEYEVISEDLISGWEGCLSVPYIRGLVDRYSEIRYWGHDEKGNFITSRAKGFHARVIQHEIDHLDGVLFPSKIRDIRNLTYEDSIKSQYNNI